MDIDGLSFIPNSVAATKKLSATGNLFILIILYSVSNRDMEEAYGKSSEVARSYSQPDEDAVISDSHIPNFLDLILLPFL